NMKFNVSWHNNVTEKEAQYIIDFFIGGYWNIISIWLNKDELEKPEYISNLLINAIKIIN
ncbi:TetR-like C-terminal domain-containing protein, partial [Fructilactobacillus sanfranciscensis]|uniref:TetR-like C-terminal domain-containing protein n=2 Tax=Fructilactobacillus sanfranciscensis TaxID=1625 RepID=UPI00177CB7DB